MGKDREIQLVWESFWQDPLETVMAGRRCQPSLHKNDTQSVDRKINKNWEYSGNRQKWPLYEQPKKAMSWAIPNAKNPKLSWRWNKQRRSTRWISVGSKNKTEEKESLWHTGAECPFPSDKELTRYPFSCQELPSRTPVSEPPLRVCQMKAVLMWNGGQSREH